ncbi:FecR family protein [Massilibacteroides sp.]|uniref:FecR family protein n=1 Tax=Massilibacteroides sp. TaxID=2034766 RepID=UPI0026360416|nr:FecR family protein [Massilibacteroides sp.]MDD4515030.1 FecR family protein [Massilibacteroides sp.]
MLTRDKKQLIKKLLHEDFSTKEEKQLLEADFVNNSMNKQWVDAMNTPSPHLSIKQKIWGNIIKNIWNEHAYKQLRFYKAYSIAASILLVVGTIYFLHKTTDQTNNLFTYVVGAGIQRIESVTLPDGTSVLLGPGSRLEYPSSFLGKTRTVTLDGQAFFDVKQDKRKPFIVETPKMKVQALGTAFELFCHQDEKESEAILLNGKLKINIPGTCTDRTKEYYLLPNDKFTVNNENETTKCIVDADKYTSWRKNKIISFENEQLTMIIPRLEQWYGRKIFCTKEIAQKYRFTFKVRDESLEKILFILQQSSPILFEKTESEDYILSLKASNKNRLPMK